jgi:hypothetical protein
MYGRRMVLQLATLAAVAGRPRRAGADWTPRLYLVGMAGAGRWVL